jgi:hypothetical protein
MPVKVTPTRPPPWSMIAVVFTDGATSPGNHDRSDVMMASGYLIPGRLIYVCHVGHGNRSVFLIGRLARHRPTLIVDRDVGHGIHELLKEIDLRSLA